MNHRPTRCSTIASWSMLVLALLLQSTAVLAEDPLHQRIDQAIQTPPAPPLAPVCTDGEFLRRIYLDLTGSVPNAADTRAFLADTNPGKRAAVIDRLLASPQFVRHLTTTLDVMLMERRPDKHVKQEEWLTYLHGSVSQNKPWNILVREILNADGSDEKIRAASKFYLDREGEPNLITRDIGRMFFGMDLGCCQCHDHPLVDTYLQADYYGLYAFVSRGTVFTDKQKKVYYAEKAEGDVKFASVFTKQQDETRPCLPGDFEIDEPAFLHGDEYAVPAADGVRAIPKFSRRSVLAETATNGANKRFNRNIANRLWAMMMGRGLVEPLDMHHLDNPPSHPELLNLLGDEIARINFDIKAFLRELALSQTYQRALQSPPDLSPAIQTAAQLLPALEAQQQQISAAVQQSLEAAGKARAEYDAARKAITSILGELATANGALGGARKAAADSAKLLADAQQQLAAKKDVSLAVSEAAAKAAEAAAKLVGDTELTQAAEKFKTKAAALTTELTAAEKLVSDRAPGAKSAADALAAAQAAAAGIVQKLDAAKQQSTSVRQSLTELTQKMRDGELASQVVQVKSLRAKSLAELGAVASAAQASQQKLDALTKELTTERQVLATLQTDVPQLEVALTTSKTSYDDAAKRLAVLQTQFSDRQNATQTVADAVTKAEVAIGKLPQDAELKQAADVLKSRREKLLAEVAEMQKQLPALEQAAKASADLLAAAQQKLANTKTQFEALQKSVPAKESLVPTIQSQVAAEQAAFQNKLNEASRQWSHDFGLGTLEPLSPEQLTWSVMTVTGIVDQYRAAAEAEVNKAIPIDPATPADPAKVAEREKQIEQKVHEKLNGNVATFVGLFGHSGGQPQRDFFATVDQALYFANAGVLQSWLNPSGENLMARLIKHSEPSKAAEELYVSVLTRFPTADETAAVTEYLQSRTNDRQVALQELAWALITSNEFRFSH